MRNKKIFIFVILIVTVFITACGKKEAVKVINSDYIKENRGIVFNDYALAIDYLNNDNNTFAIFKKKSADRYVRLFSVDEYSKGDRLLATDKYIYVFYEKGGFVGYKLNSTSTKKVEADFSDINGLIYYPVKIYGFSEDYIYISYYKDDSKKDILYAKINSNLKEYTNIEGEKELPLDLKNYIDKES